MLKPGCNLLPLSAERRNKTTPRPPKQTMGLAGGVAPMLLRSQRQPIVSRIVNSRKKRQFASNRRIICWLLTAGLMILVAHRLRNRVTLRAG